MALTLCKTPLRASHFASRVRHWTIPWRISSEFFFAFLLSRSAILGLVLSLVMFVWVKLFCEYSYFGPKWTEKAVVEIQAQHRSRIIEEMGWSIERGNSEETTVRSALPLKGDVGIDKG
uniref:Uncharacterized protein n=1 Tax=Fusarium oxysporum (strain Fo5176) TaxID=660025 RepID=A0A0D2YEF6_FUSOF